MVRSHGCCICGNPVADAHHLRTIGHMRAAAMKNGDDYTIPLCRKHHDDLHMFGDERLFLDLHGIDAKIVLGRMKGEDSDIQGEDPDQD